MKAPISWLKDFVDIDITPEELAEKLLSIGFEVEEIIKLGDDIKNVVTGQIVDIKKHENADSLQICQIDVTESFGGVIQIVTGAPNVFVGAKIPVALCGAELPTGLKIKKGKLRGVESNGMLCSGGELQIGDDVYEGASVDGILILKDTEPLGVKIQEILGLDESILDIGITANRPDCNSIIGIAREVAAVLGKEFKEPDVSYIEYKDISLKEMLSVEVKNDKLCKRYMAKGVDSIKIEPSPKWMQDRLALVGLNSINNVVDITNYVLIEMGQPMHAFDLSNIGGGKIVVRSAEKGEKIVLLDEKEVELNKGELVICDEAKPMALAGIMGGLNSGITTETKTLIFEAAKFTRDNIRHTSKALNVRSDSSSMYEKGVNFSGVELSLKRALHLIEKVGAGRILGNYYDLKFEGGKSATISYSAEKIDNLLGIAIPREQMLDILNSLNIKTTAEGDIFTSVLPTFREDISGYPDIAEELIRYYGYDHIEGTLLKEGSITNGGYNESQKLTHKAKSTLVELGFNEIITYSFVSPKYKENLDLCDEMHGRKVKILNPLGEDLSVMRTTLCHSMLEILASNYKKKNESAKLFEIASVYIPQSDDTSELPCEFETLMLGEYGDGADFFTIKGHLENVLCGLNIPFEIVQGTKSCLHPYRRATVTVGGKDVGYIGEVAEKQVKIYGIAKRTYVCEVNLFMAKQLADPSIKYKNIGKFPAVERDLAFVVDEEVEMASISKIIVQTSRDLLEDYKLFDIYRGNQIAEGKKSLAFSMKFRSVEKTLTEQDIEKIIIKIVKRVDFEIGGKLRTV
ncbi:MAG: phenylalanine--tRNA ligase subunit beta [Bacillota bacterium]